MARTHKLYIQQISYYSRIFYKIRTQIPHEVLRMIYFAFVHSQILYSKYRYWSLC